MPLIQTSSCPIPPFPLNGSHIQTILPSYLRKKEEVHYQREEFVTPDDDILLLDWSCIGADRLIVISHGLCGHTRRHYVLSLVKAFNEAGWDCLAWNYRGTGGSPGRKFAFTTQNASFELDWVVRHAIEQRHYTTVFLSGYSMGGNLVALYLTREARRVPPQVIGAASFCATIDLVQSALKFHSLMGRFYAKHFVNDLKDMIRRKAERFPDRVNLDGIGRISTFEAFDDRFTAPYLGLRNAQEYYFTSSAARHLESLDRPMLLIAPTNDPFLAGDCYPVRQAQHSPFLFLEMPRAGGHCGFITPGPHTWWPAGRAVEFAQGLIGSA